MLQVEELDLSGNKLADKCICDLIHRAMASFQSLIEIYLRGNRIGNNSIKLLGKTIFSQLSYLTLSDCPLEFLVYRHWKMQCALALYMD